VLLTLLGSFTVLAGVILHSISNIMQECKNELITLERTKPLERLLLRQRGRTDI
jgi:hypothetical protein